MPRFQRASRALVLYALVPLPLSCGGVPKASADSTPVTIPAFDAGARTEAPVAGSASAEVAPIAPAAPASSGEQERSRRSSNALAFDRAAAAQAMDEVDVTLCGGPNGPHGPGHVLIVFHPSGQVQQVDIEGPLRNTRAGACVASLFQAISIPPFAGSPVHVGKRFFLP